MQTCTLNNCIIAGKAKESSEKSGMFICGQPKRVQCGNRFQNGWCLQSPIIEEINVLKAKANKK